MRHTCTRRHRRPLLAAANLAACAVLVSCSQGDTPAPLPPATTTPATTSSSTAADPSVDADAWREKYSANQLAAYDQAAARLAAYETQSEPIWAAGQATPAAEKLFKSFFPSPVWENYYNQLKSYQQVDVKLRGLPTVLSSRAKAIASDSKAVTLLQCVDYTPATATQRGKTVPKDPVFSHPLERTIELDKPDGYDWLIYSIHEPSPKEYERCEGGAS